MKTTIISFLTGFLTTTLAVAFPSDGPIKIKTVSQDFVLKQKKILSLFEVFTQMEVDAEYYKIGHGYDIQANIKSYTVRKSDLNQKSNFVLAWFEKANKRISKQNQSAVKDFLQRFSRGYLPLSRTFSVFKPKMRGEATSLFQLFYNANDFDTFYKTSCWARVHINAELFAYAFEIAVLHRPDTKGFALPAPCEIYPYLFFNAENYTISDQTVAISEEQKLSYFTDDIGLNSYYWNFHTAMPFWMVGTVRDRSAEFYFNFYQRLLAYYYMNRLTNGLGEIPDFSWRSPIKTGLSPSLVDRNLVPFTTRNNYYHIENERNVEQLQFLENYEDQFLEYLIQGKIQAFGQEIDLRDPNSINFISDYWNSNIDSIENGSREYEIIARNLLGTAPQSSDEYSNTPVILEQFQTAPRDPVFYQLFNRILFYYQQYQQYLQPYTKEALGYPGVQITDVKIDDLVTSFNNFIYNVTSSINFREFFTNYFLLRLPYLVFVNPSLIESWLTPFDIVIDIVNNERSEVMVRIFLGPGYHGGGPVNLEDDWMYFVQLDMFTQKLVTGNNTITRSAEDFVFFKDDSVSIEQLYSYLDQGKIPIDQSVNSFLLPRRLMLPKGTKLGYPFKIFVHVQPYTGSSASNKLVDDKPLGYPLDRPVIGVNFQQNNMYFKDVYIRHEDQENDP